MNQEEVLKRLQESKSAPFVVDTLLHYAEGSAVSDIHIDCGRNGSYIRFRRQGLLETEITNLSCSHTELIACFKVSAGIRIDEHKVSHDGRISYELKDGRKIDLRLSILPTYHGENCVIRLLKEQPNTTSFAELGLTAHQVSLLNRALSSPQGCICVVGPTGSGKTTTLYAALRHIYSQSKMLVTIEDPIEYEMESIRQVQVTSRGGEHRYGLSFPQGLRAILRQDPDVIMVGEIRDKETAVIAMNASLTGHLVLTSLHAKDCAGAFVRLEDIGIEMSLAASSLTLLIAQRLVRTVDGNRIGVYEFLVVTEEIQEALRNKAATSEINKLRKQQGNHSLKDSAHELLAKGQTSWQELERVFGADIF